MKSPKPAVPALLAFVAALAFVFLASLSVEAQSFQENWFPNEYRLYCEENDSILPFAKASFGNTSFACKNAAVAARITEDTKLAMSSYKALGFLAPRRFGERIGAGKPGKDDYIRLYDIDEKGIASTAAPCPNTFISVKKGILDYWRDYLVFEFIAHEAFHVVAHAYPTTNDQCQVPAGWIFEGIADAIALDLTRKKFGSSIPHAGEPDKVYAKFAGLRRYDVPLNIDLRDDAGEQIGTGLSVQYNTSSLFRFIADTFHDGEYLYFHDYLKYPSPDQDWMAWMNYNLETRDKSIRKHLGLVHSAFLASYAGWGDPGMPGGKYFGRKKWRDRAFGSCETVRLSRTDAAASLDLSLRPSSAKCVEVIVAGVGPQDRVTVQVGAVDPNSASGNEFGLFDELYLGLADSTDNKSFNCARWIRDRGKKAIQNCTFIGDTGKLEIDKVKHRARVWNVVAQSPEKEPDDKGPAKEPRSQIPSRAGKLANTYVISRMAPKPTDRTDTSAGGEEESFRLWFVLDVGQLDVSPEVGVKKPSRTARKRTVSRVNGEPVTNSQETVPMQNTQGAKTVTYTNPSLVRPSAIEDILPMTLPNIAGLSNLHTIQLSNVWSEEISDYEDTLDEFETYVIKPAKKVGSGWEPRSIRIGELGTFPVFVTGGLIDGSLYLQSIEPGTLEVLEFTYYSLRATVKATLCNISKITETDKCPDARNISGEIVRGFPGARLPGKAFTIYETPGTAIYRRAKLGSLSVDPNGDGNDRNGTGTGTGSGGGGAEPKSCDCSCKTFDEMQKLSSSLKGKRPTAAQMARLQQLSICARQCAAQWGSCRRQ